MNPRVLILGGTGEGRRLAEQLDELGVPVVSSLAGRVREPRLPKGEVRIGGFGGPEGLAEYLRDERIGTIVDATHPFARRMTDNAVAAAATTGTDLLVLRRRAWSPESGDDWHQVESLAEAAEKVGELGQRVLLTTGRQGVEHFATARDNWFLVRSVDEPEHPLPPNMTTLLARGPFDTAAELDLLRRHRIEVVVSKNSGGTMTEGKLTAARQLGLPVVLVRQPELPKVPVVHTVEDALAWLRKHRSHAG
ncbi:precorrin-6A/cobalt-precorrin-6A reductase [Actinopolyspora xinjiangensis]|uniref:Precorrin-6A/cobalt-precorrin-6A reductase n=1 Tax=Actinopolyspora xinjiangensis TaxID=405564 RepID=A0A1H0SWT5_9ACTN|nr:cobalt-precorrin-6A reductase [Actinopolyspora xinjiangensis]SDP46040.1 precorrin-6A/cobalt-precorrin-6A reductase [Actinopolyspora xinjiangensis]